MASRLLTRSTAAAALLSRLRSKTLSPTSTRRLLFHGGDLPSLPGTSSSRTPSSPPLHDPRRCFSSPAAAAPATADGMTVNVIARKGWTILPEAESDWRSHSAAIAQSISLIKKRLKWGCLIERSRQLAVVLDKPDLWDDPVSAGKVSREHGEQMGKIKAVNQFERELIEHIDMLKLAREEGDKELEAETMKALLDMRRNAKEKELEALLSGDNDSCSCFIEVQAGAGGTESMDWAAMVMNMYKSWARRRGYAVSETGDTGAAGTKKSRFPNLRGAHGSKSLEAMVKSTGKESLQWGLAAGMYSGLTYGLREVRGTHDWKNSAVAGAITGAALSLTSDHASHEQTVQCAITGAALSTAANVLSGIF